MRDLSWRVASVTLVATGLAGAAQAETAEDSRWLRGGLFWAGADSSVQLGRPNGSDGSELDLEADLGLDNRKFMPTVAAGARLGGNWQLNADLYSLSRRGSRTIAGDIVVDDVIYPVGAAIDSSFRSTTLRVAAGYSIVRRADLELGASLGLHLTGFSVSIEGLGSVGQQTASAQRRAQDLLAPLPTLGIYGNFSPLHNITLSGRADYLRLKIAEYTGALINAEGSVAWRMQDRLSLGVAYRHVDYALDVDKEKWRGGISYRFSGPMAFVEVNF